MELRRGSTTSEFAARTRVLLFHHIASGIAIDVLLGGVAFDRELIARSSLISLGRFQVRVPAPEDLVTMKAVARRGRDIVDIEAIMDVHLDLDLDYVRRWLREFSSVLDMPEILEDSRDWSGGYGRGESSPPADGGSAQRSCALRRGCRENDVVLARVAIRRAQLRCAEPPGVGGIRMG